jgi:ribosome-interacting GTPase 1
MPTNVTPEYKKAEEAYRAARDPGERLDCLKEMLRTIPKHKGTEHLQADIKSRIKQLTEALSGPKKGGRRTGPATVIRAEGAAQIALVGPPNAGKSLLHSKLTGSRTEVGPYPYATRFPEPGMLPVDDANLQLIDLPPVSADHSPGWLPAALQPADAALLVVDVSDPDCVDQLIEVTTWLSEHRIRLVPDWPKAAGPAQDEREEDADPFRQDLPTLLVANKSDLDPDPDEVAVLEELTGVHFPAVTVSAETGAGLNGIGPFLFDNLGIVRVYTKTPGKPAETNKPFTLRNGDTVLDVATLVHKDIAGKLRFARIWGNSVFDGQQVGPEHAVEDGDIVELHMG